VHPFGDDPTEPIGHARRNRRLAHSPHIVNGRPADLQPLDIIDPLNWEGKPVPERRWIVPDLIPEGNVTMLGGDGAMGKTLLALQLLVACALGKPWIGYQPRRCKAVGIFCEDDAPELQRRIGDILRYYDATFSDLEDLTLVTRVGEDNMMLAFPDQWAAGQPTPFYYRVEALLRDTGAELLVLDSLHDFFGGNENARPHARQYINELRSLTVAMHGCGAVLQTAHPSIAGRNSGTGEAGSTAWNNTVRSRLYLTAPRVSEGDEPDRDYRELRTKKANYSAMGAVSKLRWNDGVFVRDDEPTGILGSIKRRAAETIFLDMLAAFTAEGRFVSETRNAGNYAPRLFANRPGRHGYKEADFRKAMETLFAEKKITLIQYGRPGDRRRKIALAEAPKETSEGPLL